MSEKIKKKKIKDKERKKKIETMMGVVVKEKNKVGKKEWETHITGKRLEKRNVI